MKYFVKAFYDGRYYSGYQRQPNLKTVEQCIIDILIKLRYIVSPRSSNFRSASRTDKGVSALANIFSFETDKTLILPLLNSELNKTDYIRLWSYVEVDRNISVKQVLWKKYWYILPSELVQQMNLSLYSLKKICKAFEGIHDFKSFCKFDRRNTIREIISLTPRCIDDVIILEFKGQSFIWEQIRRIVSYIINYSNLSEELKNISLLLKPESPKVDLRIQPANPQFLLLIEQNFRDISWNDDINEVNKIIDWLELRLLSLKKEIEFTKVVKNIFSIYE